VLLFEGKEPIRAAAPGMDLSGESHRCGELHR